MRFFWNIAVIASVLFLPWWVGAVIAVAACFFVNNFYEIIIYGIIADSLYGSKFGLYGFSYIASLYSAIIFIIIAALKKKLAW